MRIQICSIIPRFPQLRIIPDNGSPLFGLVPSQGEVLSYDAQRNYPFVTSSSVAVARQLQSALPKYEVEMSVLNLAAVPRGLSVQENWKNDYLSGILERIPYGKSVIEVRGIGKDIASIDGIDESLSKQDIICIPIPFESHISEIKRLVKFIKTSRARKVPLMTSGTGVWGRERELLNMGFDFVFTGTVSDRGEEFLLAILNGDFKRLALMPGSNFAHNGEIVVNKPPRSFYLTAGAKIKAIQEWKSGMQKYRNWTVPEIRLFGRPDLLCNLESSPLYGHFCGFQDLPHDAVAKQSKAGKNFVLAADSFFPIAGCPRQDCNFCHTAGRGWCKLNSLFAPMAQQYSLLGITDLIPTDDNPFLLAATDIETAKQTADLFGCAAELGLKFFYGNGIESWSLNRIIVQSKMGQNRKIYQALLNSILDTSGYFFLPIEQQELLSGHRTAYSKLRMGREGWECCLSTIDEYNEKTGHGIEVSTGWIFEPESGQASMEAGYRSADEIALIHPALTRYNGFAMLPNKAAPHILELRKKYWLITDAYPDLAVLSIFQIAPRGCGPEYLEEQLAAHYRARAKSHSPRMFREGTYS